MRSPRRRQSHQDLSVWHKRLRHLTRREDPEQDPHRRIQGWQLLATTAVR